MPEVSFISAFLAGVASFLSPCVLPLVPGYISYITGVSADDLSAGGGVRGRAFGRVLFRCVLFVLGFSVVFVSLGASATTLGKFLLQRLAFFTKLAGAVIILFGIHLTHVFQLTPLNYEKKLQLSRQPAGNMGAFIIGLVFAFGWTPCIGPMLAGILLYASAQHTVSYGISLLSVYSLGMGLPFIITGLSVNGFLSLFNRIKKYIGIIEVISGIALIVVGILFLTDNFQRVTAYFLDLITQYFPSSGEI